MLHTMKTLLGHFFKRLQLKVIENELNKYFLHVFSFENVLSKQHHFLTVFIFHFQLIQSKEKN